MTSYHDRSWHEDFGTAGIIRNKTLLKSLRSAPHLQALFISFNGLISMRERAAMKCNVDLSGFRNLTSFEYYCFYGKRLELVTNIAGLLSRCPGIKRLGLGMACDGEGQANHFPIFMPVPQLLEQICLEFQARGGLPLSLEVLKLGHGLPVLKSERYERYLDLLFRQCELKTLHIFNGEYFPEDMEGEAERLQHEWGLLSECVSLRQISLSRLDRQALTWLSGSCISVQELFFAGKFKPGTTRDLCTKQYPTVYNVIGSYD